MAGAVRARASQVRVRPFAHGKTGHGHWPSESRRERAQGDAGLQYTSFGSYCPYEALHAALQPCAARKLASTAMLRRRFTKEHHHVVTHPLCSGQCTGTDKLPSAILSINPYLAICGSTKLGASHDDTNTGTPPPQPLSCSEHPDILTITASPLAPVVVLRRRTGGYLEYAYSEVIHSLPRHF